MKFDRRHYIGYVAQELGIQISEDDPVFACVLLNRWALNTLLDEGMARIEPSFTAHEHELNEMMKQSLLELARQLEMIRVTYGKLRKSFRIVGVFLGLFVLAVISFVSAVAIVSNMPPPKLSEKDMQTMKLGQSIESQWSLIDQKTRDIIQAPLKKKN